VKILIVGAGATGGYFGAQLIRAGRDVTFLVRSRRAEALRTNGLRIIAGDGTTVVEPKLLTAGQLTEPAELVLLSVKATALQAALEDLAPAVGPQTTIVPFLNGMSHLDALTARFGADNVLGGVVKVAVQLNDAGDIVQVTLAPRPSVVIGELDGRDSSRLRAAHDALDGAGFDTDTSDDIVGAMWHKWVFIAAVGAVTCLARGSVGDIVAEPGGSHLATRLLAEASAVASAAGHPLPAGELANTARMITEPGSTFTSSMFRDVEAGQHTEVEHILGDLTRKARAMGISTPLLDLATLQLRVYERRMRQTSTERAGADTSPSRTP
jgi:2-dehydropantoate 2-reductase